MKVDHIKEKILLFLFYALGVLLLIFAFNYDNFIIKISGILLGGILTFTYVIKVIYYFYIDGKLDYKNIPTGVNLFEKKKRKVDIYKLSHNLFLYGLVLAISSILFAFTNDKSKVDFELPKINDPFTDIDEIDIPPATIEKPAPPVIKEPEIPKIVELPKVVQVKIVEEYIEPLENEAIPDAITDAISEIEIPSFDFEKEVLIEVKDELVEVKKRLEIEEPAIIFRSEIMPEFIGGQKAMLKYLYGQIKYPSIARGNEIEGKVYIYFVIDQFGKVTDSKIVRDIGGGCGTEALRVVNSMPKWKPGTNNGKPVKVAFNLPLKFKLN